MAAIIKWQKKFFSITDTNAYVARISNYSTIDFKTFCEHMAAHNTPYSAGTIKGVLTDMADCIKELILDGKTVKLDDLATFKISLGAKAADTEEQAVANEKRLKLQVLGVDNFSSKKLNDALTYMEAAQTV